jgi:hypothetical protein
VLVEEEIYAYRETQPDHTPAEHPLDPPLSIGWTAPALWIDLPRLPGAPTGQLIGWSLALVLPLVVLANPTDSVPAYDAAQSRLYLIDAHPGGSGLAAWLYENLDTVLPLAYDLALDCKNDALLEPAARIDMDWLLSLLGGAVSMPTLPPRRATRPEPPAAARPASPPPQEPAPEPPASARPASARPASSPPASSPPASSPPQEPEKPRRKRSSKPKAAAASPPASPPPQEPAASPPASPPPQEPEKPRRKRSSKPKNTPPDASPPASPPPQEPEHAPPDADAILARLQRLRAHSEAAAPPPKKRPAATNSRATPRFRAGDRVICRPYGEGVVYDSRIEHEHELLRVEFPEHGRLEIDPAVSLVRHIEEPPKPDNGE